MQTVADLQLFHVLKYTITGNKYKFAQIVQETATNVHKFGQLLYKIITQYSRQCLDQSISAHCHGVDTLGKRLILEIESSSVLFTNHASSRK